MKAELIETTKGVSARQKRNSWKFWGMDYTDIPSNMKVLKENSFIEFCNKPIENACLVIVKNELLNDQGQKLLGIRLHMKALLVTQFKAMTLWTCGSATWQFSDYHLFIYYK